MTNHRQQLTLRLELIWWVLTAVVVLGVLFPIYAKVGAAYPFYGENILFIVVFITFTRFIFLLRHSFLADWEKVKILLVMVTPLLIFLLINQLNFFQTFLDEQGVESFLTGGSIVDQEAMRRYISAEMLLFGVGSLVATVLLPFRLIVSIWRVRNRGTV